MDYVLRLQALDGYAAKFSLVFSDRFTRVLHVHHTGKKGDNPHYHFCLTTDYKKDALRKYLKGHFDLASGNKHLSLKDWDGSIRACAYLYHEGTPVTNLRGFTDEELSEFKMINVEVKQSQTKVPQVLQDCYERMCTKDLFGNPVYTRPATIYDIHSDNSRQEHRRCFDILMDLFREKGDWIPNKFQFERYINRVLSMCNGISDQNYESFKNDIYSQYFGFS